MLSYFRVLSSQEMDFWSTISSIPKKVKCANFEKFKNLLLISLPDNPFEVRIEEDEMQVTTIFQTKLLEFIVHKDMHSKRTLNF